MTTDLEQRLRAADPLPGPTPEQTAVDQAWLSERARAAVLSSPVAPRRSVGRTRTLLAAAAAVALVAGGGAVAATKLFGGDTSAAPAVAAPPLKLSLGASSPTMGTCIRFSVEDLARMPVAFSGTVTDTSGGRILIDVDHWYRGGDAAQVSLASPDGTPVSLEGIIPFEVGQRYLLSASDGAISYCGFSGPWTQDLADAFAAAFPAS